MNFELIIRKPPNPNSYRDDATFEELSKKYEEKATFVKANLSGWLENQGEVPSEVPIMLHYVIYKARKVVADLKSAYPAVLDTAIGELTKSLERPHSVNNVSMKIESDSKSCESESSALGSSHLESNRSESSNFESNDSESGGLNKNSKVSSRNQESASKDRFLPGLPTDRYRPWKRTSSSER